MGERVRWNSNLVFLMAMIGSAVGLGNIWRFPYLFFSNGRGTFLIPYLVAILILGFPFLLLEYSLGAKIRDSVLNTFGRVDKKFKLVAWIIMLITFLVITYYLCIVGWDFNYFLLSFTKGWGSNPDAFFNNGFLQSTTQVSGIFNIVPYILVGVLILWSIVWFISHRDLNEGIGKFTSIFVPLLFILGIGIALYNVTLSGSYLGFMQFFRPDWSALLNLNIWLAAFGQILFTLSLGITVVLTYSSHLPDNTNLTKNALIVIIANCGFELINAVGVFSLIGHMAYVSGVPFDSLITQGSGLAFVAFPHVFNIMGLAGSILGPLFFFCILIAGLTTAVSYIEPLVDSLESSFNFTRKKAVTVICVIGFLISCIFTTALGNLLITIFDEFLNNFALILMVIAQCIIFGYIYKLDSLMEILNKNTWFKIGSWWKYIIKYILPCIMVIIWIGGLYDLLSSIDLVKGVVCIIIVAILMIVPFILNRLENKRNEIKS